MTTPTTPSCNVAITTRNEPTTIGPLLHKLLYSKECRNVVQSITVVDDSTDTVTRAVLREWQHHEPKRVKPIFRDLHLPPAHQCFGSALSLALTTTLRQTYMDYFYFYERGLPMPNKPLTPPKYVVQMDAGGTHDPAHIPALLVTAEATQAALTIAARPFPSPSYTNRRAALSQTAAWLYRNLWKYRIHADRNQLQDVTTGFRVWRAIHANVQRDIVENLRLRYTPPRRGFAIQLWTLEQMLRTTDPPSRVVAHRLPEGSYTLGDGTSTLKPWMVVEALKQFVCR